MNNEEIEVKNKETKWSKFKKFFGKIPKIVKIIFAVLLLGGIFWLGIIFSSVYTSQTKTTKLGLEDVGELVTQTGYLTIIQDNKEHRELFNLFQIPFTESRQIFSYDIEIDASVDFSKISYEPNDEKKEIVIKLPHAKIYKATLNTESLN